MRGNFENASNASLRSDLLIIGLVLIDLLISEGGPP
jgi:hypothetical protein